MNGEEFTAAPPLEAWDPAEAWSRWQPTAAEPWNWSRAAHLWRRAACGATGEQLGTAIRQGPDETLEQLLVGADQSASFDQQAQSMVQPILAGGDPEPLSAWFLHRLVHSPHPLRERMTLFWHGHFATSAAKVQDAVKMHRQNEILRRHALGRFGPMLEEISQDPAMLIWLDSTTNRKTHPNENFAREVMELFTLGRGQYTEHDIKEAARAFTGWEVRQGRFSVNPSQHDPGQKTVLGKQGAFDGLDILSLLLEQPVTGRFLISKLYRYLFSDHRSLPDRLSGPLATQWKQQKYDTTWLLRQMLSSRLFYSLHAWRQKIKSPVELAVGLLRSLEAKVNMYALAEDLRDLGQAVFYPPNVKGWDGGTEWINSAHLLGRVNLVAAIVEGSKGRYKRSPPWEVLVARQSGNSPAQMVDGFATLLIAGSLPDAVRGQLHDLVKSSSADSTSVQAARLVHALGTLPEFQLA